MIKDNTKIKGVNITIAYGNNVLMHNLNFEIKKNDIFIIMGGSGCGKSSLMRIMTGLKEPTKGKIFINTTDFYATTEENRKLIM